MGKLIISTFLACYLLMGAMIFPLGDLSLMKDLPKMYRSYCEIKNGKPDIIDFIGDYVLGGKIILGHNKHDAPTKSDGSMQFQHQADYLFFFVSDIHAESYLPQPQIFKSIALHTPSPTSDYQNNILKPPIA